MVADGTVTPTAPSLEDAVPLELKDEIAVAETIVVKAVAGLRRTTW